MDIVTYLSTISEIKPNVELAFAFYEKHILNANMDLEPLLNLYQFKSEIPSWKWELFAAILVGDIKKKGNGIDLIEHEVKAYQWRNPPEYQYHRKSWQQKLEEDKNAKHICVWHKDDLKDIDVFLVNSEYVSHIFESWRSDIISTYEIEDPEKRCRKHLARAVIEEKGKLLLVIRGGKLVTDFELKPLDSSVLSSKTEDQ